MQENLDVIKAFVAIIQTHVPGSVKRLTVALDDGGLDMNAWDNGDDTLWNVVIGDRGSATFSVAEAKSATDEIIERVVKDLLGLSPEEKAAQQELGRVLSELTRFTTRRAELGTKAETARKQLADKQAALDAERGGIEQQIAAANDGLNAEEKRLQDYRDALMKVANGA